jgi:transposase InsO family protein
MHLYKKMGIEIAKNYYLTFSEVEHKYNLKKHIKKKRNYMKYTNHTWKQVFDSLGLIISMGAKKTCADNIVIESYHSLLKKELFIIIDMNLTTNIYVMFLVETVDIIAKSRQQQRWRLSK